MVFANTLFYFIGDSSISFKRCTASSRRWGFEISEFPSFTTVCIVKQKIKVAV